TDATALAQRGLFDGDHLQSLKRARKYLRLGSDVAVLARMFRERWDELAWRTATSLEDLDAAEELHERITFAVAQRSQQSRPVERAAEERLRAFTLVARAYDQVRRAVIYVQWDERDFDRIVPSLWAGRGKAQPGRRHRATAARSIPRPPSSQSSASSGDSI